LSITGVRSDLLDGAIGASQYLTLAHFPISKTRRHLAKTCWNLWVHQLLSEYLDRQFPEISSLLSYSYIYLSIAINKSRRIFELEKPKTPEQLRLDQLRATSKRASDALKIERDRQKAQRAQKTLQKLRSPALNTPV
jgi:hypothetical protein